MARKEWPWTIMGIVHFVREIPEYGPAETLCGRRTYGIVRWPPLPPWAGDPCRSCRRVAERIARDG